MIVKPSDIIYHIIGVELNNPDLSVDSGGLTDARNAHPEWKMGFAVNKKINSKKLIEGIAKESKLFPLFKGDTLSFNSIKETYDETDVDPANGKGFTIKDSDVISYKFDRTKIEDIKTKVVLNYHYDYANNEFTKTTKSLNIAQTAVEIFEGIDTPDYVNSYYGIEVDNPDGTGGQGGDPIEVKYIRHQNRASPFDETIVKLQQFLLGWYCNQHSTCKIRLPLSYLFAEVGDIIAFPELLNGRKAYGEDYSLNHLIAGNLTIRNGQEIYPYWIITEVIKSLENVSLGLIQLHRLISGETDIPPIAIITGAATANEEETIILDGSESHDPNDENAEMLYNWIIGGGNNQEGITATVEPPPYDLVEDVTVTSQLTVLSQGVWSESVYHDVTWLAESQPGFNLIVTANSPVQVGGEIIFDGSQSTYSGGGFYIIIAAPAGLNPSGWYIESDLQSPFYGRSIQTLDSPDYTLTIDSPSSSGTYTFNCLQHEQGADYLTVISDMIDVYVNVYAPSAVAYNAGWNIVSLPFGVEDGSLSEIYPDATPETLYSYGIAYVGVDALMPGKGYWLHFPEAGTTTITGTPISSLTLSLTAGWNLFGGISEVTNVSGISDPGGIIVSGSCYRFNETYENASVLTPGQGYWINAITDGDITISSGG